MASKISQKTVRRVIKPVWFLGLSIPAILIILDWLRFVAGAEHGLGFNPQEFTNRFLGDWALRILLFTLAITPLARLTKSNLPVQLRRMTGLFAFFYVSLHVSSYVALDQIFAWAIIWEDIIERKYITIGMINLVLLLPLAITSTNKMVRRLGAKRWKNLHRLIYVIAPLATLHFEFMAKGNQLEPKIYMGIAFALLAIRAWLARAWWRQLFQRNTAARVE